jgi:hypothetical protein
MGISPDFEKILSLFSPVVSGSLLILVVVMGIFCGLVFVHKIHYNYP